MHVDVKWKGDMCFEGTGKSGEKVILDVPPELGGNNQGVTPMEAVLVALGGCTGLDVLTILRKMKLNIESLNIELDAERAESHPKKFTHININYQIEGVNLVKEKVEKAINLTQEKYCSVLKSLNAEFSYSFELNKQKD